MRLKSLLASLTASLLTATPLFAQDDVLTGPSASNYFPTSGAELVELISSCEDDSCMSYVSGVIGGISIYAMLADKPSPFCAGNSVETETIRDVIVDTINDQDRLQSNHPAIGVLAAFGNTWPCLTDSEIAQLRSASSVGLDPDMVDQIENSGNHIASFGPDDSPIEKTMLVFHDPDCQDCQDFRDETRALTEDGWKITIYPVSMSGEDAIGYGAVGIALKDAHPDVARKLYNASPEAVDFETALSLAQDNGVAVNAVMNAIVTSGAYDAVKANSDFLSKIGVEETPAWIVGNKLYTGLLSAPAIRNVTGDGNGADTLSAAPDQSADDSTDETMDKAQAADDAANAASAGPAGLENPYVQVAIFRNVKNAQDGILKMQDRGFKPDVKYMNFRGRPAWRVFVGPLTSADRVARAIEVARAAGFTDAYATDSVE